MVSMLFMLIPIAIIVFILLLILMNRSNWFSFVKFYFTIISIVSIVWMAIAFGIVVYQQWMNILITDDEYMNNRGRREIQQCSEPTYKNIAWQEQEIVSKTPEEITACETKKKEETLSQRSYEAKEGSIWWLTRWIIFLILFLTHYPRMVKEETTSVTTPSSRKAPTKRIAKK